MENWYKIASKPSIDEDLAAFDKSPWVSVDSSWLDAIAYYELAWVLEIRLKNGKRYSFMNVPPEVYEAFLESPSKGEFFNSVVRQNYTKY